MGEHNFTASNIPMNLAAEREVSSPSGHVSTPTRGPRQCVSVSAAQLELALCTKSARRRPWWQQYVLIGRRPELQQCVVRRQIVIPVEGDVVLQLLRKSFACPETSLLTPRGRKRVMQVTGALALLRARPEQDHHSFEPCICISNRLRCPWWTAGPDALTAVAW